MKDTAARFEDIVKLMMINLFNLDFSLEPLEIIIVVPKRLADKLPKEVVSKHTGAKAIIMEE